MVYMVENGVLHMFNGFLVLISGFVSRCLLFLLAFGLIVCCIAVAYGFNGAYFGILALFVIAYDVLQKMSEIDSMD